MKKLIEKGKNYIFLLFITLCTCIPKLIKADSGFDSSYDSGGSWDSGGSYDYDYDSGSGGGEGDPQVFWSFAYLIGSVFLYFFLASKFSKNKDNFPTIPTIIYFILIYIGLYFMFEPTIVFIHFIFIGAIGYLAWGINKFPGKQEDSIQFGFTTIYWLAFSFLNGLILGEEVGYIALFLSIGFLVIYGISMIITYFTSKNKETTSIVSTLSEEKIKKELGEDFDINEFNTEVFNNYKDIQIAWMNRDLEPVRHLLSDDMFNMYRTQVATLIAKNQTNMMEDIEFISCSITDIKKKHLKIEITVTLQVTCRDYIVNSTGKVLRGNKYNINHYTYSLKFVRSEKNSHITICPNCGAALENTNSDKCEYCNTVIVKDTDNYVMTDKKMLRQFVRGRK